MPGNLLSVVLGKARLSQTVSLAVFNETAWCVGRVGCGWGAEMELLNWVRLTQGNRTEGHVSLKWDGGGTHRAEGPRGV